MEGFLEAFSRAAISLGSLLIKDHGEIVFGLRLEAESQLRIIVKADAGERCNMPD